jgi:hypothetical protein
MRRLILFLIVLIIPWNSCTHYQTFRVEGIVPDKIFNGSQVYLVALDAPVTRNVDSTIIRNGSFSFSLKADSSIVKILRIHHKYPHVVEDLVVIPEPGTLRAVIDVVSYGKGTRLNDILQQWKEDKHAFDSVQLDLLRKMDKNRMNQLVVDSLENLSGNLRDSFHSEVINLIDANLNNGIGLLLFKVFYNYIPPDKRESIIKSTNGEYFRKDAQMKNMFKKTN